MEKKIIKCDSCDKEFKENSLLLSHKRSAHRIGLFECNICKKGFTQLTNLRIHRNRLHGIAIEDQKQVIKCDICNLEFGKRASDLRSHKKKVHRENLFKCEDCTAEFTELGNLKKHFQRIHEKSDIFKCDTCDKIFHMYSELKTQKYMEQIKTKTSCVTIVVKNFTKKII